MQDGNDWGALLVMWLLGAPLVGALLSLAFDGTRRRAANSPHDRGAVLRDAPPPMR